VPLPNGAGIIVLIDGVFHQEAAVAHREVLAAIKQGITVVGASSMGALRAAELYTLGMTGIGKIFGLYRDGKLVSDDEVALVFDPASGYALSEPLINIRCTLKKAEAAGIITAADNAALLAAAKSVFYPAADLQKDRRCRRGCHRPGNAGAVPCLCCRKPSRPEEGGCDSSAGVCPGPLRERLDNPVFHPALPCR